MLKVLAIDDEPEIVSFVTSWMSRRNHHADGETDGRQALRRLRQHHYDLVLLDLSMPTANGLSLISQIKEISPGSTVVIVSAILDQRVAALAIREGGDMCLLKPIGGADLDRILQTVVRRKTPTGCGIEEAAG